MAQSINGWTVLEPGSDLLVTKKIPGVDRSLTMRKGVLPLFLALAVDYDREIARIDAGGLDDWGYAYRQARMSSSWSDHSSGTAVDFNATEEGAQGPWNFDWWEGEKARKARALLDKYEIIEWGGSTRLGGEYETPSNWDWMHWTLAPGTNMTDVERIKQKLNINNDGTIDVPTINAPVFRQRILNDGQAPNVSVVAQAMRKVGLEGFGLGDLWGEDKRVAWKKWERRIGVTPDGIPEYASLKPLGDKTGLFKTVKQA